MRMKVVGRGERVENFHMKEKTVGTGRDKK
jgi:hypothetical protein